MGLETIMETVNSELFGVWFLIGAVLVFFMQCGFAMVETGFTRAKNAGNIIMKNLIYEEGGRNNGKSLQFLSRTSRITGGSPEGSRRRNA